MKTDRRRAVAALTAAGLLWGATVPLSKVALEWLPPGWLAFARFGLAAAVLLAAASRAAVRRACTPLVLGSGAAGYGGSVVVQNIGIARTSVTHAALLIGATPVLVAVIAALWHRTVARPVAWAGFAVSLAGVGLVTGGRGGGATAGGDALVLASLLLSATFTVAQARLLRGRDPVAVTAVQFLGATLAVLPFSVATEGVPPSPARLAAVLAAMALVAGGTLLPFTLFAYGQSRVSAEVAGAFLNLEPLVGAAIGILAFGDPAGPAQAIGGAAIIAGIALSSLPLLGMPSRTSARASAAAARGEQVAGPRRRSGSERPAVRPVRGRPAPGPSPRSPSAVLPVRGRPAPARSSRSPSAVRPVHGRPAPGPSSPRSPSSAGPRPWQLRPRSRDGHHGPGRRRSRASRRVARRRRATAVAALWPRRGYLR